MTIETTPIAWTVRQNANGRTFSASAVVTHCVDQTIEVHLGSAQAGADFMAFKADLSQHFYAMGYRKARWLHNGKIREVALHG